MHQGTHRDPAKEQRGRPILRDWNASGKTRAAFCRARQLSVNTFDFGRREIGKRDRPSAARTRPAAPSVKPVLLPITITSSAPLTIQLTNGTRITVPGGFNPQHLQAVLPILEGKPC